MVKRKGLRHFVKSMALAVGVACGVTTASGEAGFRATLEQIVPQGSPPPVTATAVLRCPANPFYRYSLQRSSSLAPDSWVTVLPRLYASGDSLSVQFSLPSGGPGPSETRTRPPLRPIPS